MSIEELLGFINRYSDVEISERIGEEENTSSLGMCLSMVLIRILEKHKNDPCLAVKMCRHELLNILNTIERIGRALEIVEKNIGRELAKLTRETMDTLE